MYEPVEIQKMKKTYNLILIPQSDSFTGLQLAQDLLKSYVSENYRLDIFDFQGEFRKFLSSGEFSVKEKNEKFFLSYFQSSIFKQGLTPIVTNFDLNDLDLIVNFASEFNSNINILLISTREQYMEWGFAERSENVDCCYHENKTDVTMLEILSLKQKLKLEEV